MSVNLASRGLAIINIDSFPAWRFFSFQKEELTEEEKEKDGGRYVEGKKRRKAFIHINTCRHALTPSTLSILKSQHE